MRDVELRASVYGELFFASLIDLLAHYSRDPIERIPMIDVLLMSPHRSQRTVSAFERVVHLVQNIEVPDTARHLNTHIRPNIQDNIENIVEDIYSRDNRSVVVIVGKNPRNVGGHVTTKISGLTTIGSRTFATGGLLWIDPEADICLSLPTINFLVVGCVSKAALFDTNTSQVVVKNRPLEMNEISRVLSWARNTDTPSSVRIVLDQSAENLNRLADPPSTAWNSNLPWLVLELIGLFRDRKLEHLPIRPPPDPSAFLETISRLYKMGLVGKTERRKLSNTVNGTSALSAIRFMRKAARFPCQIDIHAARLIASARSEQGPRVRRVLLRLAAISIVGTKNFCGLTDERPPPKEIQDQCNGTGQKLFHRGSLWAALGIYQDCFIKGEISEKAENITKGPLLVNGRYGFRIWGIVSALEDFISLAKADNEEAATLLGDDEIARVDQYLLQAWFHRVVRVHCRTKRISDMASSITNIHVSEGTEYLDLEARAQVCDRYGCFYAIYDNLRVDEDKSIVVDGLTYLPYNTFNRLEVPGGATWLAAVKTNYPIH
ncbi:hypothetical protein ABKA04_001177 [Annulohypoxylon sp. FPYF3050]